ncbi:MAG: host specificity protein J [Burkholderiales bacterium]|nr:host specificity protein J [Burkholderiales bacterium]
MSQPLNPRQQAGAQLLIQGAKGKGGGGKARAAVEEPDSLRSTQYAEVIDILSEGECEGLVDGLKSVFLDGVPVQNADGTANFSRLDMQVTTGTPYQSALSMGGVQVETAVSVLCSAAAPVVRTVADADVDRVRITFSVPQLTHQNTSNGDLGGTTVDLAIDVQSSGGGWVTVMQPRFSGKTTSTYTRSYQLELTGPAPHNIRVRRLTADAAQSNVVDKVYWASYTTIKSVRLRYPHTAVARIYVDAQQFSRIPTRAYDWAGLRVAVPSNYDPLTLTYTGTWDGTFKLAWTANPAWILYDLITHERYGLGRYIDASALNKWGLYQIGRYCDEFVSDGRGGQEPRFQLHVAIYNRAEALQLVRDLAAVFRGMVFWSASTLAVAQDAPSDPELLYTPANVVDGLFTYSDVSERTLHSVYICWWNDRSQLGKRVPEVYAPQDLIQRYGIRELELSPIGVATRGQAARVCRWARHSEHEEGQTVTFRVGSDGAAAAPGKVFRIADPDVAGERLGGRLRAATASTLTLDAPVDLRAGETYTATVLLPATADQVGFRTEERTVTTPAGAGIQTLTVAPPFSQAPQAQTVFVLQSSAVAATTWRCLAVTEVAGQNQYEITAVAHNPSKYAAIEQGLQLQELPITRLRSAPLAPTGLTATETIYISGPNIKSRVTVAWVPAEPGMRYRLTWRSNLGAWRTEPETAAQNIELTGLDEGPLELSVRAVNALDNVSPALAATVTLLGKTAKPELPDAFAVVVQPDGTRVFSAEWSATPKPVDLLGYVYRYRQGTGWAWDDMLPMSTDSGVSAGGDDIPGFVNTSPWEHNQLLAGTYTVALKTIDTSRMLSDGTRYIQVELPDPRLGDNIASRDAVVGGWPGTKVDCVVSDGALVARDRATWATLPDTWSAWTRWVWDPVESFSYTMADEDFGAPVSVTPYVLTEGEGTVVVEEQHNLDGSTWSPWALVAGPVTCRSIRIRVTVTAPSAPAGTVPPPLARLTNLQVAYGGATKSELINDLDPTALGPAHRLGVGRIRAPLRKAYAAIVSVQVVFQNLTSGPWTYSIDDKDPDDGPLITMRGPDGNLADPPLIDIAIRGF